MKFILEDKKKSQQHPIKASADMHPRIAGKKIYRRLEHLYGRGHQLKVNKKLESYRAQYLPNAKKEN